MSRGKAKPSIYSLSCQIHNAHERKELDQEMHKGNDRSIALVMGAMADEALRLALTEAFIKLDKAELKELFEAERSVLNNMSAKIRIGYAIGAYGKSYYEAMSAIRHIRNA